MKIIFSSRAWEDCLWWQLQDRKILKRINTLIAVVNRNGNEGIGKPEPLKHGFQGYWSRRINDERPGHRRRPAGLGPITPP
jgi:toxin YoeB